MNRKVDKMTRLKHVPATRTVVFGPPAPRATRFPELGFAQHGPGLWRIIDLSTGSAVGSQYKTKVELMGDLERFAREFGCVEFEIEMKSAALPKKMQDAMAYSATAPKSVCGCGHTGDGAKAQHLGYGGHGACNATPLDGRNECQCAKFTWAGWTPEYKQFMADKGHMVK